MKKVTKTKKLKVSFLIMLIIITGLTQAQQSNSNLLLPTYLLTNSLTSGDSTFPQLDFNQIVGTINGTYTVNDNGAAIYSIPILIPPGSGGMLPSVSIDYNSQSGDGWLGKGWSISGLSSISRMPKTFYLDNRVEGIKFNNTDHFVLDGNVLIPINGNNGDNGTEYRTEAETFSQIFSFSANGSAEPDYFIVHTKDGRTIEYGKSTDSRQKLNGLNKTLAWHMNIISNANSNYIRYNYINDIINERFKLDFIEYTGNYNASILPYNKIKFNYINDFPNDNTNTPNNRISYIYGCKLSQKEIINEILVYNEGNLVRKYSFNYINEFKTLLKKITLSDANGYSFNPTIFNYTNRGITSFAFLPAVAFYTPANGGWNEDHPRFTADVNGDGMEDIVGFSEDHVYVSLSNGQAYNPPQIWYYYGFCHGQYSGHWQAVANDPNIDETQPRHLIDVNGDGMADIVGFAADGVYVALSTGSSFSPMTLWIAGFGSGANSGHWCNDIKYPRFIVDVNGDKLPDIVGFAEGSVKVALNTGSNFISAPQWDMSFWGNNGNFWYTNTFIANAFHSGQWYIRTMADVNGDGLADIIGFHEYDVYVSLSNGINGFSPATPWIHHFCHNASVGGWNTNTNPRYVIDLNGDGMADIIGFSNQGVEVALSNGLNQFILQNNWSSEFCTGSTISWSNNSERPRVMADVNGDGLPDIVGFGEPYAVASINTGHSFLPFFLAAYIGIGFNFTTHIRGTTDANGDGRADIITFGHNNVNTIISQLDDDRKIQKIRNGLDFKIQFSYKPLINNTTVYSYNGHESYPFLKFSSSFKVVDVAYVENGIGLLYNNTNYQYYDAIAHLKGKGFLGFKKITAQSYDASTLYSSFIKKNEINYNYCFKYLSQSIENGNGAVITTDYDYIIDSWPNKRYLQKLCISNSLDALSMNKITKDYCLETYPSYDGYGNPQTIITKSYDISNGNSLELTQTEEIHYSSAGSWCSFKPDYVKTTKEIPNETPNIRKNAYIYDSNNGNLIEEKIDVADTKEISISYNNFDVFGNSWTKKVTAPFAYPPLTSLLYNYEYSDIYGRFLNKMTNPIGQIETFSYEPKFGNLIKKTDIDKIITQFEYDSFGRLTKQKNISDGTFTQFSSNWETSTSQNIPSTTLYKFITTTSCEPNLPVITLYDKFEREVQQEIINLNGNKVFTRKEYNSRGLIDNISLPFFNSVNILWTNSTYDNQSRKLHQNNPDGSQIITNYNGKITTTTSLKNGQSQQQINEVNSLHQSVKTIDNMGNIVKNNYYSSGLLKETWIDGMSPYQHTVITYDLQGNRLSIFEPNSGSTTSEYNAYGKLTRQKDAKGNIIEMKYDQLGRITLKTLVEGSIEYLYDVEPQTLNPLNEYAGKLSSTIAHWNSGDITKEFYYDNLGREYKTKEIIDGKIFEENMGYDICSRLNSLQFPDGITINNNYKNGELFQLKNINTNKIIWQSDIEDNFGNISQSSFGENGITLNKYFENTTGRLTGIYSSDGTNDIQNWEYGYDNRGNLSYRKNNIINNKENFTYDQLNRLININKTMGNNYNIQYDNLGNIVTNDYVGNYTYDPLQINGITQLDNNPGSINTPQDILYSSYNKALEINENTNNYSLKIIYGPEFSRKKSEYYENQILKKNKYFILGNYEVEENLSTGEIINNHYIMANDDLVAINRISSITGETMNFIFKDNLNSFDRVTDENANISDSYSYNPWGNPRDYNDWDLPDNTTHLFSRGFTGHEHLDKFALINMNGRLYDPLLGRFLSPDNYMQAPDNSQNFNRYSYCINNPLKYTDPSGELFGIDDALVLGTIALFSGGSNCIANQTNIHNFWQGLGYFGIGVASAAAGLGVGSAVSGALNFGGFAGGAIVGAAGGGSAGFVGGAGNSWASGTSFSDGLKSGLINGLIGAFIGGAYGGLGTGVDAYESDANFWNGSADNLTVSNATTAESEVGGSEDNKAVILNEDIPAGAKPTETGKIAETAKNPNYGKFGKTRVDKTGKPKTHYGVDYVGKVGDNVYVMYDGKVIYVGNSKDYGPNFVRTSSMINGKNYNVDYGHMSQSAVSLHQNVNSGQLIGKMGREGNLYGTSFPTHVHIAVWRPVQGNPCMGYVMPSWK
ncbi:MAG: FG-GAP-like repeat-containing protein [Bacteroidetes bacterium]|nr:FG-GAP-like repeat-containing protein [Bacteroidota bacterium]